jgi:anti-anti-sigma factor
MDMTFETVPGHPGALRGQLAGTFDVMAADDFWHEISRRVGPDTTRAVFDLTELSIMTSAGLGILVRLFTRLRDRGGGVAIFGCSDRIREIMGLVMLTEILKVRDSEDEAWAALEG